MTYDRIFADRFFAGKSEEKSAVFIFSQVNRRFFTGYGATDGAVLITDKRSIFLTDFRYITDAHRYVKNMEIVETADIGQSVREILDSEKIDRVYVEQSVLTLSEAKQFAEKFAPAVIADSKAADILIGELRATKDNRQLELIKKSQSITDASFEHILPFIKEGVTERSLALEIEFFMRKNGAERVAFDLIICAGENGDCPHAVPGDYRIKQGDFITMDIGAVYNGWHSDMTRTVALGEISAEQKKVYDTVLAAQLAAMEKVKAGANCCDVDAAARDLITEAGYGPYFGHSTGHGVGMEIHEAPTVSARSAQILQKGMIITDEPGIYLPGKFGVRIEDMLCVTENGYENLTKSPKNLIIL